MNSETCVARCPAVVIQREDREKTHYRSIQSIVVSRTQRGIFTIHARAQILDVPDEMRRWVSVLAAERNLKEPVALREAIATVADDLGIDIGWAEAVRLIAKLDWVVASSLAKDLGVALPAPPSAMELARQRPSCLQKYVEVSVEWGYDLHTIRVPMRDWIDISNGEPYSANEHYIYEGERFTAHWMFLLGRRDSLEVTYDDGGTGFIGTVKQAYLRGPALFGHDIAKLLLEAAEQS